MTNADWTDATSAAALFAIDPIGLGGVSLRAGPGLARDHWLAMARIALPDAIPIRRLPVNASDDRVLGGLDLAETLRSGRSVEQRGLLAETDGGVVILAMAERIEPAAAARLTAAMDLGAVPETRYGKRAAARFGVVALDEGIDGDEHTPAALLDRLAFHVDLGGLDARAAAAPDWDTARLTEARGALADVSIPDRAMEALCAAAMALGVDSIRASVLATRAARAAAALDGRVAVIEADVILAGRLVLAPRATRLPPQADQQPDQDQDQEPESNTESDSPRDDDAALGDRPMEDVVLEAARAAIPPDLLAMLAGGAVPSRQSGRMGQVQIGTRHGRPVGARPGSPRGGARLHILETLKAAAPMQRLRREAEAGGATRIRIRPADFRIVRFRQRTGTTTVFAVDASGSAALHRLGEAKGAVELLLAACYVRRDHVALITFRGRDAAVLLPPTGSLTRAKRCLAGVPGGGATPLAAGIDAAVALADGERRRGRAPVIVLLTDGRANIARDGTGGRPLAEAETLTSARLASAAGFAALLVDTSPRPNPFARRVAEAMGARYVPLPQADASSLSRAVRDAAAS